jgi:threonine aldolase
MYNILIDLRSDTVTKPCSAMRKEMSEAGVGDSFYGDDYTTKELEEYCANLFGTQAALFMISGTMANQVAIRCHLQAGEEIISDNYYHIAYYEASATADLGKAVMNLLYTDDGIITTNHLEFALMNKIGRAHV